MTNVRLYLHVQHGFLHECTLGELHMHHGNDTAVGVSRAQADETPRVADGILQQVYERRRMAVVLRRLADELQYRDGELRHLGDGKLWVKDGRLWVVYAL